MNGERSVAVTVPSLESNRDPGLETLNRGSLLRRLFNHHRLFAFPFVNRQHD
jgi:hypothetical protein